MYIKANKKIVDKIQSQAESFIAMAEKKFRLKLDYSEESLVIVDDLMTIFFKIHREHFIKATVFLGSYFGEVIRANIGGKWLKDLAIGKVGKLKGTAHPMSRAMKRLASGTDASLVHYYKNLKLATSRDSSFAPDKKKVEGFIKILQEDNQDRLLLERMLNPDEIQYAREEAAELLGRLSSEDRIGGDLIQAAEDPALVYYAAIALQGVPVRKAYKPLMKYLRKSDSIAVQQQILLALGKIGAPESIEEIIKFLDDDDEILSHFAALAIGDIGGDTAIENLLAVMAGLKPGKRLNAITALEVIGDSRAVPALIEALFSREEEVREAAARALQYIPDERAFKPLAYCLNDRSSRIRIFAAYALANTGNKESLNHIKKLLTDDVQNVRLHATHLVNWLKQGKRPEAKVI